jgi:hypothetical protein
MSTAASSAPRDRTCLDLRCLFAVAVAITINSLSGIGRIMADVEFKIQVDEDSGIFPVKYYPIAYLSPIY